MLKKILVNIILPVSILSTILFIPSIQTVYQEKEATLEVATTTKKIVSGSRKLSYKEMNEWKIKREADLKIELAKHFNEENSRVALAIIKRESSMNTEAKAYNCRYTRTGKDGKVYIYSTFCKKGDEQKAWSVDCGIAQINFAGTTCPDHTKNIKWSIDKMVEMYKARGFSPWVAYTSGDYLKCL